MSTRSKFLLTSMLSAAAGMAGDKVFAAVKKSGCDFYLGFWNSG